MMLIDNIAIVYIAFSYIVVFAFSFYGFHYLYKDKMKFVKNQQIDEIKTLLEYDLSQRIDQIDDLNNKMFIVENGLKEITYLVSSKSGKVAKQMAIIAQEILNAI